MGLGLIGELDASGDGPRTLPPVRPKAATASNPQNSSPDDAPVCVADQSTPGSVDQVESEDSELMELIQALDKSYVERLRDDTVEIMAVLRQLGGNGRQYVRERSRVRSSATMCLSAHF